MTPARPEFARPVDVLGAVASGPVECRLEADVEERAALARRFGLEALERFTASFKLTAVDEGGVAAKGQVSADVIQACVVSLEPLWSSVQTVFDVLFRPGAPKEGSKAGGGEEEDEGLQEDPPETLPEDGVVDLGELAAQYLALAIDPYPRKPGAALPAEAEGGIGPASPFAVLAALKVKGAKTGEG